VADFFLAGGSIVLLRRVMEVELEGLGEEIVVVVMGVVDRRSGEQWGRSQNIKLQKSLALYKTFKYSLFI
jgi:hypothetical protein